MRRQLDGGAYPAWVGVTRIRPRLQFSQSTRSLKGSRTFVEGFGPAQAASVQNHGLLHPLFTTREKSQLRCGADYLKAVWTRFVSSAVTDKLELLRRTCRCIVVSHPSNHVVSRVLKSRIFSSLPNKASRRNGLERRVDIPARFDPPRLCETAWSSGEKRPLIQRNVRVDKCGNSVVKSCGNEGLDATKRNTVCGNAGCVDQPQASEE